MLQKTCTIYRGVKRANLCKELFGQDAKECELTKEQVGRIISTMDSRSTWHVKRHGDRNAIYAANCLKTVLVRKKEKHHPCLNCLVVKKDRSLISALNHTYAQGEALKYVTKNLMTADAYQATLRKFEDLQVLQNTLESLNNGDFSDFMSHVAILARKGLFDNQEAVRGMIMGCSIKAERAAAGKSTRGMRIDAYLDNFLTTLGAMSKSALKLFNDNFLGQTARSQRMITAKTGMYLRDGVHYENFKQIATALTKMGYDGPVAASSDQTVCVKTLQHHNGCIVGAQGGDIPFSTPEELKSTVQRIMKEDNLCSQVSNILHGYETRRGD